MKTENFDDAIRRKAESIQYSIKEEEIDQIHKFVKNNRNPEVSGKKILKLVFGSFLFVSVVSLLGWNLKLKDENKELNIKLASVKKEISIKNEQKILSNRRLKINVKPNELNELPFQSNSLKSKISSNTLLIKDKSDLLETASIMPGDNLSFSQKKSISSTKSINNTNFQKAEDQEVFKKEDKISASAYHQENSEKEKNDYSNSKTNTSLFSKQEIIENKENPDTLKSEIGGQGSLLAMDSLENLGGKFKIETPVEAKQEKSIINKFFPLVIEKIKNTEIGIGLEKSNGMFSGSLLSRINLNSRWNIVTGIKLSFLSNENFSDDHDFHTRKGVEFHSSYHLDTSDSIKISNINLHYQVIQIPISLKYLLTQKNNYNFIMGLGTNIDIYAKQRIEYEHQKPINSLQQKQLLLSTPVLMFNNMLISTALQKTWGPFSLELSAFLCPQLKRTSYKPESLYYGIGLHSFYKFH